ncbi:hypothetical protein Slin15195_G056860 [Septoria linicola]|uniref:Uncharacterized protein n=1 Tax=Septoria linicola TaxID=215465 RepID=A0A9Q9EJN4_9PEZI|nr:hypothetical protein Slin15195_G056860 [Septoria linicola]
MAINVGDLVSPAHLGRRGYTGTPIIDLISRTLANAACISGHVRATFCDALTIDDLLGG